MDKDLYNMNEVPQSDLSHINLVAIENNEVVTSSIKVAEVFGKQHKDVLKAVKSLDISEEFRERNFALSKIDYQNGNIKKQLPMYYITRDGFMFLVMGFTGKMAARWKGAYIKAFNEMEKMLNENVMANVFIAPTEKFGSNALIKTLTTFNKIKEEYVNRLIQLQSKGYPENYIEDCCLKFSDHFRGIRNSIVTLLDDEAVAETNCWCNVLLELEEVKKKRDITNIKEI